MTDYHQHLPQPLGRIRDALRDATAGARADHALGFVAFEATVRWLGLCLLAARAQLAAPVDHEERVRGFFQQASIGSWVELLLRHGERIPADVDPSAPAVRVLDGICTLLRAESSAAASLHAALRETDARPKRGLAPIAWAKLLGTLPAYRNDFIGHTGYVAEHHYEYLAPSICAAAEDLLSEPTLGEFQLSWSSTHTPAEGGYATPRLCDRDGEPILSLDPFVHVDSDLCHLFDRSPRRGGAEYLDFATGNRVWSERSMLASPVVQQLSFESRPGSERWAIEGRLEVIYQPLRWSTTAGAPLPYRVVIRNHSRRSARCELSLTPTRGSWQLLRELPALQVPAGGQRTALIWVEIQEPGVVPSPVLNIQSDIDGDHAPVEHRSTPDTVMSAVRDSAPLLGREAVLARADELLATLTERPGATLVVAGESGSGRSSVLAAIEERAGRQGVRVLRGSGVGSKPDSLSVFRQLLGDLLGASDRSQEEHQRRIFARDRLGEYLGDDSSIAPYFISFLMGDAEAEPSRGLRGLHWLRLVGAASVESPVLLLIDDGDELDGESLELLHDLVDRCRREGCPVGAVIAITGSEQTVLGQSPEDHATLAPLDRELTIGLLDHAYPGLPFRPNMPWLVDHILESSGGNARLAAKMVRRLSQDSERPTLIERTTGGSWDFRTIVSRAALGENLPASAGESPRQWLADLPEAARVVVEHAALLGIEFPVSAIERVVADSGVLDTGLDQLEARGVITPSNSDLSHYRFASGRLIELVVRHMRDTGSRGLQRKRKRLAAALIEEYGDSRRQAERIGGLLLEAGQALESIPSLLHALEYRIVTGRYAAGISILDQLELARDQVDALPPEQEIEYWCLRGDLLGTLGKDRQTESADAVSRALSLAREAGAEDALTHCLIKLAEIETRCTQLLEASHHIEEAMERIRECPDTYLMRQARNNLGVLRRHQGRLGEARAIFEEVLAELDPEESPKDHVKFLINLGQVSFQLRDYERAEDCFREGVEACRRLGNLDHQTIAQVGLSSVKCRRGDWEAGRAEFHQAVEVYQQLQNRRGLAKCYHNLSQVEWELGHLDHALDAVEWSISIRNEIGDAAGELKSRITRCDVMRALGDFAEAAAEIARAGEIAGRIPESGLLEACSLRRDSLALARGESIESPADIEPNGSAGNESTRYFQPVALLEWYASRGEHPTEATRASVERTLQELAEIHEGQQFCALAAAYLRTCPSAENTPCIRALLADELQLPCGAPRDLVHAARQPSTPQSRDTARRLLDERAALIRDPTLRARFLEAHGYAADDETN